MPLYGIKSYYSQNCSSSNKQPSWTIWGYCHIINSIEYSSLYALTKPIIETKFKGMTSIINANYAETLAYSFTTSLDQQILLLKDVGARMDSLRFVVKDATNLVCKAYSPFTHKSIPYLAICSLLGEIVKDIWDGSINNWVKYDSVEAIITRSFYLPAKAIYKTTFREYFEINLENWDTEIAVFINVPLRYIGYDALKFFSIKLTQKLKFITEYFQADTGKVSEHEALTADVRTLDAIITEDKLNIITATDEAHLEVDTKDPNPNKLLDNTNDEIKQHEEMATTFTQQSIKHNNEIIQNRYWYNTSPTVETSGNIDDNTSPTVEISGNATPITDNEEL